ncbi:MAG: thioredoxin domain-containing protein, partial [Gammaproteobacteria bacterium]|nr:thioredoxin domain-containing protein [Gammaproteobacteria bacterium]
YRGLLLLFSSPLSFASVPIPAEQISPLADSPSPYLQMHADDPVGWRTWERGTLRHADENSKLIFLSSGYFSCHWCHVMQRESFKNHKISRILNRSFVSVKIDRELSPVVDRDLIDFVRKTTGSAGWPLQVILLPDGTPLLGFVYLPPDRLEQLLLRLEKRWHNNPGELRALAKSVIKDLNKYNVLSSYSNVNSNGMEASAEMLLDDADMLSGGFGGESKFPETPHLMEELSLYIKSDNSLLKEHLIVTLDSMATLGLRDAVGGGFFRYTIDPDWNIPHFEKMLYDNAQLAQLYLRAGKIFHRADYLAVGLETIDFMVKQMRNSDGIFISSLSAVDGNGQEGGYYLWDRDELEQLLDDGEKSLFDTMWYPHSTMLDGDVHLFMPDTNKATRRELEDILSIRKKLQRARLERTLPRDHKVLSGWNGLLLSALSELLRNGEIADAEYREIGDQLADTLSTNYWSGDDKKLLRLRGENSSVVASLDDYAYVADGLFRWGEATDQNRFKLLAGKIVRAAKGRLYRGGKWHATNVRLLNYSSEIVTGTAGEALPSPVTVLNRIERLLP